MEHKVIFEEIVRHTFYVDTEADDILSISEEFERMANASELCWDDGEVVKGQIVKINDIDIAPSFSRTPTESFVKEWALKAWKLEGLFNGIISGGIDPVKRMISCSAKGNTVSIKYDFPETCGLSDVRYHVTDPNRIRTDVFVFTDGKILMNGKTFPGEWENEPWTADEAKEFIREYADACGKEKK